MDYVFHLIEGGLHFLHQYKVQLKGLKTSSEKAYGLDLIYNLQPIVYCLQKVKNGFLPLDRKYKPIGFNADIWANYDEYPFLTIPDEYVDLSIIEEKNLGAYSTFHLYNDSTSPRYAENIYPYINTTLSVFKKVEEIQYLLDKSLPMEKLLKPTKTCKFPSINYAQLIGEKK